MLEKAGRNLKVAFVASVLAAMLATAPAQAGRYHVYSCRTPTGEVAPTDGWSGSVPTGGPYDDYALNTCAQGGALVAALGDASPHTALVDQATWAFAAPAGETIAGGPYGAPATRWPAEPPRHTSSGSPGRRRQHRQ